MDFAQRVKTYRKAKNMTQQELADLLGVSNKSVSRWETEGSYPDPPVLLQLARALGVSVDDLLDDKKPLRTLSTADWQGLLSFAFAIGGGILFFLLELFTPTPVCYGVYLAAMLYGCYLQRYYTYRSRWFFWSNLGMDLAVNLAAGTGLVNGVLGLVIYLKMGVRTAENADILLGMLGMGRGAVRWVPILSVAVGLALTAVTQVLLRRWMKGEGGPTLKNPFADKRPRLGVKVCRPSWWSVLPAALAFLLPCYFLIFERADLPLWLYEKQMFYFHWAWLAVGVVSLLPFLGKAHRGQIVPVLLMMAVLWNVSGLLGKPLLYYNPFIGRFFEALGPHMDKISDSYYPVWRFSGALLGLSAAAVAVFLLTSVFRPRLRWVPKRVETAESDV